jgi:hypothetical protein
MTANERGKRGTANDRLASSRVWIIRDRRGRRVLGTAQTLRAAIQQAANRGEQFPLLEQAPKPDEESAGPVFWRRTL